MFVNTRQNASLFLALFSPPYETTHLFGKTKWQGYDFFETKNFCDAVFAHLVINKSNNQSSSGATRRNRLPAGGQFGFSPTGFSQMEILSIRHSAHEPKGLLKSTLWIVMLFYFFHFLFYFYFLLDRNRRALSRNEDSPLRISIQL